MEVYWNDVLVATIRNEQSQFRTTTLTLTSAETGTGAMGADRLEFREINEGTDGSGTYLDNVRLTAAEPSTDILDYGAETVGVVVKLDDTLPTGGSDVVNNATLAAARPIGFVQSGLNTVMSGRALDGSGALDSITSFENVRGGAGADVIVGNAKANGLQGGDGNDVLDGAGGNDGLQGGAGADTLTGGDGDDSLVGGAGADTLIGGRNLIVNGSFETQNGLNVSREWIGEAPAGVFDGIQFRYDTTQLFGWELIQGTNIEFNTDADPVTPLSTGDGAVFLDMETSFPGNNTGIAQTLTSLIDGQAYQLQLDVARPTATGGGTTLEVRWNGVVVRTVTEPEITDVFTTFTLSVTAGSGTPPAAGQNRLELVEVGAGNPDARGVRLDDVRLYALIGAGEAGTDTADLSAETASVLVNLSDGALTLTGVLVQARTTQVVGDATADTLFGIDAVRTGSGADVVVGSAGADRLETGGGRGQARRRRGSGHPGRRHGRRHLPERRDRRCRHRGLGGRR
jgi:hypothetical protein